MGRHNLLMNFLSWIRSIFMTSPAPRIIHGPGFDVEVDGPDLLLRNVIATAFGGGHDKGDDGQTESGVLNDGSNPKLMGCALPIRSTESATAPSPLTSSGPHIPWGTKVRFWAAGADESTAIECVLIDNGPDVKVYPNHAADLCVYPASLFSPRIPIKQMANVFEAHVNIRIVNGASFI